MRNKLILLALSFCLSACYGIVNSSHTKPPTGSAFSKIKEGMFSHQVSGELGQPDETKVYPTAKYWIPFYKADDMERVSWSYLGKGRVIFSKVMDGEALKVIAVDYEPEIKVYRKRQY